MKQNVDKKGLFQTFYQHLLSYKPIHKGFAKKKECPQSLTNTQTGTSVDKGFR